MPFYRLAVGGAPIYWIWVETGTSATDILTAVQTKWGAGIHIDQIRELSKNNPPVGDVDGKYIGYAGELIPDPAAGTSTWVPAGEEGPSGGPLVEGEITPAQRDPAFWQTRYEQALGLPAAGRGRMQEWRAGLMPEHLTGWLSEGAPKIIGGEPMEESWGDYVQRTAVPGGVPGGETYRRLMDMPAGERRGMWEGLGYGTGQVKTAQQAAVRGYLRKDLNYAPWMQDAFLRSAFADPRYEQWEYGQAGLEEPTETYLNELQRRYGWTL